MTNDEFMKQLGEHLSAEVAIALPEAGGYAQVSWNARDAKNSAGLVRAIASAVIEKKPDVKYIMFQREYDIAADDYTTHRVLFW